MTSAPLISISLPTRNRLKLIQATIAQIKAQTHTNWELIISDNASDELGKKEYLQELAAADPRVKLHLQQVNIGLHANWVFGIVQSSARYYIACTDDDRWAETDFLERLLEMHDGKTAVVFPNLSRDMPNKGQFHEKVLTGVYDNQMTRYELCDRMVNNRLGAIMLGLFDLQIISKADLISVYDHGRHAYCETVGMVRVVRDFPVLFCSEVSYIHTDYDGNYRANHVGETVARDLGISMFLLLEDLRLAAAKDPGFEPALQSQWKICLNEVRGLSKRYRVINGVVKFKSTKPRGALRQFISTKRKAMKNYLQGLWQKQA